MPEAQRVVEAVIEHVRKYPKVSLGVVTLNLTQRDLIEEILAKQLRTFEEGERFKEYWEEHGWPFFVKNLENVQGDERDVIFISTTFGKSPGSDRVRQNFGPISRPTGWRRLNVLFTRARESVHVFSSMLPEDIVVDEDTQRGTRVLRDYLDYARRGILIGPEVAGKEPDSDFELSVIEVLESRGYEVEPQVGVAGFFIDIGVRNPARRGEFIAAVECDGATYHSGVSVRDRDRIRQEILESLGWKGKIYRIWSTDWFRNPQREIDRLIQFLKRRQADMESEAFPFHDELYLQERHDDLSISRQAGQEEPALGIEPISDAEELYVEVGDLVTYCDTSQPEIRLCIQIIEGQTNLDAGVVNETTPLAKTFLGVQEGEEATLTVPGRPSHTYRVLKLERKAMA